MAVWPSRDRAAKLNGSYLKKGDLVGHVLEHDALIARTVVSQDDIHLVRAYFRSAELRLADRIGESLEVAMVRSPAGGVDELPTPALGLAGGGRVPTLPSDPDGVKTTERVFMVDLALPEDVPPAAFGERVHDRRLPINASSGAICCSPA